MMLNCKICGDLFIKTTEEICASCEEMEREAFKELQDYFRLHANPSLLDIVRDTGLELKVVSHMLESGKIRTV